MLRHKLHPPPRQNEIALTFDDGPNPEFTPRLLDLLQGHQIKAAFFLVGKFAEEHPEIVKRLSSEGHIIGNHSWSHPNLAKIASARVRTELERTSQLLGQITGERVQIFRPPYGASNRGVLDIAREMGMIPVFWNAIGGDWEERSPAMIVDELWWQIERNSKRSRATCVVLHDGRADNPGADCSRSIQAAEMLIEQFKSTHQFVSIQSWQPNIVAH